MDSCFSFHAEGSGDAGYASLIGVSLPVGAVEFNRKEDITPCSLALLLLATNGLIRRVAGCCTHRLCIGYELVYCVLDWLHTDDSLERWGIREQITLQEELGHRSAS